MLVICEECSKKYNVDETMMRGERARFSCYECGHVIVVVRSAPAAARETAVNAAGGRAGEAR
jgi:transcription initiation factor IIE alpha subunit